MKIGLERRRRRLGERVGVYVLLQLKQRIILSRLKVDTQITAHYLPASE
jgi:hypothetical protein